MIRLLRAVWDWLLENPIALVAAISAAIGGFLVYKSNKNRIADLQDAVAVAALKNKIAKREAEADVLFSAGKSKALQLRLVEKEISGTKRRLLEIEQGVSLSARTDKEIADIFSQSGL